MLGRCEVKFEILFDNLFEYFFTGVDSQAMIAPLCACWSSAVCFY